MKEQWKNASCFLHLVPKLFFQNDLVIKTYRNQTRKMSSLLPSDHPQRAPPQATVATTLVPLSPPWSLLTVESCLLCHHSTFYTWSLLLTLPMDCQGGCGALVVRHTFSASPPSPIQKKNLLHECGYEDDFRSESSNMSRLRLLKMVDVNNI